jgi:glycogen(starch) synthase
LPDKTNILNICLVSQEYPPETGWGGIGSYIYEMAKAFNERGNCVVVLSRAVEKESYKFTDGIHVYRILPKWNLSNVRFYWRFQKFINGYRYAVAKKLDELVKKYNIDIIESSEIYADLFYYQLTRKRRPAIAVKLHTPRWLVDRISSNRPELWNILEYLAEKFTIKKADSAYSCSHALLLAGEKYFPKKNYSVVYNPISLSNTIPEKGDDSKTILFVGRLEWRKGVQIFGKVIPEVLRKRPDVNFVFLGPDSNWHGGHSLKEYILNQIPDNMKSSVNFHGGVPREKVLEYLLKASICILPSLWENFPYTCLEAMAHGCAVVGSRNGGMAEMIEDGVSGVLIDPEKPEEISRAILRLLSDGHQRSQMGQNAASRVRNIFSRDRIIEQTLEVYDQALQIHDR